MTEQARAETKIREPRRIASEAMGTRGHQRWAARTVGD
jgi:hypothetical protein